MISWQSRKEPSCFLQGSSFYAGPPWGHLRVQRNIASSETWSQKERVTWLVYTQHLSISSCQPSNFFSLSNTSQGQQNSCLTAILSKCFPVLVHFPFKCGKRVCSFFLTAGQTLSEGNKIKTHTLTLTVHRPIFLKHICLYGYTKIIIDAALNIISLLVHPVYSCHLTYFSLDDLKACGGWKGGQSTASKVFTAIITTEKFFCLCFPPLLVGR